MKPVHNSSPCALLRLPDPLLLMVFEDLSVELYTLSLLCQRLHHLALPVFLGQHGVHDPSGSAKVTLGSEVDRIEALSALRIALFVPTIAHLICCFTQTSKDLSSFFTHFARLRSLSERLLSVSEVELNLNAEAYDLDVGENREMRKRWVREFAGLCGTLAQKECKRLVVRSSRGDEHVYVLSPQKSRNRSLPRHWDARRWNIGHTKDSEQPFRKHLVLSSFVICSSHLLRPARQKLSTLSISTIQSLTLICSMISGLEWSSILPVIASMTSATLSALSIYTTNIYTNDVLKFLSRLPLLTTLNLNVSMYVYLQDRPRPRPKLSSLTTLSAPPDYIAALLPSTSALPNLQSLNILLPNTTHVCSSKYAEVISRILETLAKRNNPGTSVMLTVHSSDKEGMVANLDAWLSMHPEELQTSFALIESVILIDPVLTPSSYYFEQNVDTLTFVLPRWLASFFPALRHLSILESAHRNNNVRCSQRVFPLLCAIHKHSSSIQTVVINDQCHDLALFTPSLDVSPSGRTLNLLGFPDDVFYVIFDDLTPEDIYNLSTLSEHLQLLALPVYLSRRDIPDPCVETKVSLKGRDAHLSLIDLTALRLLPSVTSIQCLSVTLCPSTSLYVIFEYLHRLRRLIMVLSTLTQVDLLFQFVFAHTSVANDLLESRWAEMLCGLLDVILEKSCASLKITGSRYFARMHGLWETDITMRLSYLPPKQIIAGSNDLPCFAIDTDIFQVLLRPFLTQRLRATQLRLTRLSRNNVLTLSRIADAFPDLVDLYLDGHLRGADALAFVNRLPNLTWLTLGRFISLSSEDDYVGPKLRLLCLERLNAPAAYTTFLTESPDDLPCLKHLTLTCSFLPMDLERWSQVIEWLRKYDCMPTLSLDVIVTEDDWLDNDVLDDESQWKPVLAKVKRLKVNITTALPPKPPGDTLRSWLNSFTGLDHLSIMGISCDRDGATATALREAVQCCPSLQTIQIGAHKYVPLA